MERIEYYIIWVEGLSSKRGEKIHRLTTSGVEYTTRMTSAMRIRKDDKRYMEYYLNRHGISGAIYVITTYAPKGTLYKFPQI
jgi:hypothetical protein